MPSCVSVNPCTVLIILHSNLRTCGCVLSSVGCGLPVTGKCAPSVNASSLTRYFFNASSSECEAFEFEGCDINGNNFENLQECQNLCSECGTGDTVALLVYTSICMSINLSLLYLSSVHSFSPISHSFVPLYHLFSHQSIHPSILPSIL